jgi:hypothetical protein
VGPSLACVGVCVHTPAPPLRVEIINETGDGELLPLDTFEYVRGLVPAEGVSVRHTPVCARLGLKFMYSTKCICSAIESTTRPQLCNILMKGKQNHKCHAQIL